jgi:hypothetical protein
MSKLFNTFKGYSFTAGMFFILTLIGMVADMMGVPNATEMWRTFGMGLGVFVNNQSKKTETGSE